MDVHPTRLVSSDIPTCLRFWGGREAYTPAELEQTGTVLLQLLQNGGVRGTMLRDQRGNPVAHGLCVFVTERFADDYLAAPHALVGKRLLLKDADAILVRDADIAARNADGGLQMLAVNQGGGERATTGGGYDAVVAAMVKAFFELHRGYRLARIINEVTQAVSIADVGRSPAFAVRQVFDYATTGGGTAQSLLAAIDRAEALERRSLLMPMFSYTPPTVCFSSAERHLLRVALEGATDRELAERLGIPVSSVKARWKRIQTRVAERAPVVLPTRDDRVELTTRGAQVRHRILQFVRERPEELTPYRRSALSASLSAGPLE